MPLPEHDDCYCRGDVRTIGSVCNAGFGNVLLATEVTKLTRRQQWTVFRVQRPNLSTVSDTIFLYEQAAASVGPDMDCQPTTMCARRQICTPASHSSVSFLIAWKLTEGRVQHCFHANSRQATAGQTACVNLMALTVFPVSVPQRDLWTESGLRNNYKRIDATEAKKHWEFWYKWTEANCTHGYTCSKCAALACSICDAILALHAQSEQKSCSIGHLFPAADDRPCGAATLLSHTHALYDVLGTFRSPVRALLGLCPAQRRWHKVDTGQPV